jgi:hypothetical protein
MGNSSAESQRNVKRVRERGPECRFLFLRNGSGSVLFTPYMKPLFPVKIRRFLAIISLSTVFLQSFQAAEEVANVEIRETPTTMTLSNGKVRLVLNKKRATLDSLQSEGRELLPGASAGYLQIAFESNRDQVPAIWTAEVIRSSPVVVEIAFKNVSRECPLDFSTHYILRAGDSGFYNYLTWGHDTVRTPGDVSLAQYNYALRIDPKIFTTSAVDDDRITRLPAAGSLKKEQMVMDATYRLPDGGFYSKYFNVAERDERHRVHGAMSDDGLGIWVVMPSHEHLNGGREHQELNVHQAGDSHVLLFHATAAHYGAGTITSRARDGSWRKVSAPCFIYVNRGVSQAALWSDAKEKAVLEEKAWPYEWLEAAEFEVKRGTVSGKIQFDDREPIDGARVILAPHEDKVPPLGWQQQWKGYRFYGWSDQSGAFEIGKVRPGLYDLWVWRPGLFGPVSYTHLRLPTT